MKDTNQNAEMLRYTRKDLLDEWKLRNGYFEVRRDCELVRDDGFDFDRVLQAEIDCSYERLLGSAPLSMVPVFDITEDCVISVDDDLRVTVVLPENCVRVAEVLLPGWKCGVTKFESQSSGKAAMQRNEWLCGRRENPVCVEGIRCLYAYSAVSADDFMPDKILAVCRPADGVYLFAQSAWDLLLGSKK